MERASKRTQLVIDIPRELRDEIKVWAVRRATTMKSYVLMALQERLAKERWKEEEK